MKIEESEVYTADEAQKIMKISDSTFRRLVKKGVLQAGKIGGQYRILGGNILKLLNPSLPGKVRQAYHKVIESLEK